jgi:sugar lactone lactonase YvrE
MDEQFYYIADTVNSRIVKRYIGSHLFHSAIGSLGSGNDQFNHPKGIAVDGLYVYVADTGNHRIVRRLKSDLSYFDKIGSQGNGNEQFESPCGICLGYPLGYPGNLYVADTGNHRIVKWYNEWDGEKYVLHYDTKIGSQGSGNDQFESPCGIAVIYGYIFVADTGNHRIIARNWSTLAYDSQVGSFGSGNDQFSSPYSVAVDETNLFVADTGNHRIQKREIYPLTLNYISKIGSQGLDDDKFESPKGIAVYYTIPPM